LTTWISACSEGWQAKISRADGFLVDSAFSFWGPFEMLDRVRDVDSLSLNSGQPERSIKDSPGRSDKRLSGDVFFVTRLFSDEQILFRLFSACEHCLRRISP
jgi:hypothetical protein